MTRLGCKLYGHIGGKTIETYRKGLLIKNYKTVAGKIVFVKPYQSTVITGKHRCAACGAIYLGDIVIEHTYNDKPHGMP